MMGFPGGSVGEESSHNAGDARDLHLIPGGRRSQEKEMATHWSIWMGNPMDRGALWAMVHGVASVGHNLVTKPPPHDDEIFWFLKILISFSIFFILVLFSIFEDIFAAYSIWVNGPFFFFFQYLKDVIPVSSVFWWQVIGTKIHSFLFYNVSFFSYCF